MFRQSFATVASATVASATLALTLGSGHAAAAEPGADDLAQIRAQIKAMKDEYEARIRALETRLQQAEAKAERAAAQSTAAGGTTAADAARDNTIEGHPTCEAHSSEWGGFGLPSLWWRATLPCSPPPSARPSLARRSHDRLTRARLRSAPFRCLRVALGFAHAGCHAGRNGDRGRATG